jgi:hypothetical protein
MRATLKATIWQAVAQSGVDVSGLPQAELDKLVGAITEGVLKEVDDVLSQASGRPSSAPAASVDDDDENEIVLWEGRPFLSLTVQYQITNERVRVVEGLFGKERFDVELVRIQDVDHKQNLTERAFNLGDIFIRSHDPTRPELTLNNISNPQEIHEILRRAILKARKRHNLSYREEM